MKSKKSDTFSIRVSMDTLREIRKKAVKDDRSINYTVNKILEGYFKDKK